MIPQIVLCLFLVLSMVFLAERQRKIGKFVQLSKKIKCDIKSYPIIGHSFMFIGDAITRMQTFQKFGYEAIKNGGLSYLWMGDKYYVVAADPTDIEVIMKTSLEKDDIMRFARKLIGNGAIFAPVAIWRPRRKVLAPTFSPKNLNNFVQVFARRSDIMVEKLKSVTEHGVVSVWQYLTTYSMEAVCESTLGLKLDGQNEEISFLKSFSMCSQLVAARMLQPWLYPDSVYKLLPYHTLFEKHKEIVCGFIDEAVRKKRANMKINNKVNQDLYQIKTFLDLLIKESGQDRGYSDLELHEETLVIVAAGTDTSAVGASFVIALLARHPDVQKKVVQELVEVFGDSDRPVNTEDLPYLKYLDAVIKETLRLYPPVPVVVRKIEKDVKLPSGITLINGCGVVIHIWATNRNPQYWGDDAEQFRPERFFEPLKHPAAFMAFSHGPRSCIGYQYAMMSMKTAIATFLRSYQVLSADDEGINKPLRVAFEVMMKDVDGFKVKLEKRKEITAVETLRGDQSTDKILFGLNSIA